MLRRVLFGLWLISHISGFLFASYGVLRESFADSAEIRAFGEGRYGEGTFGGGLTDFEEFLVNAGIKTGLLPTDRTLTVTDRKRNAAWAIAGVLLLGFSILLDLANRFLSHKRQDT